MSRADQPETPEISPGIGSQLRVAREAAGVNAEDFAREANLTVRQVQAMETDEYSWFNGPVFIKGYIRVYAKRFGLNGDALIAQFEQANPEEQPKLAGAPMRPQPLRPSHDFKFRQPSRAKRAVLLVALLAVIVLVVGLSLWWFSQRTPVTPVAAASQSNNAELDQLSALESGDAEMSLSTVVDGAPLEAESETAAAGVENGSVVPAEAQGAAQTAVLTPLTQTSVAAPAAPAIGELAVTTDTATTTDTVPAAVEGGVNAVGEQSATATENAAALDEELQKLLRLEFSDECWVQIKNAQGRVIHESIHKAGDAVDLDIVPPVQLWFGRARAVNVTYNGTAVALPLRSGANSVKFTFTDAQGQSTIE